MTDPTSPASEEPTAETPAVSPPPAPVAPARRRGPSLGHIVLGAVLVLIGVGWLLEALEVADVPWRFLLPSVLILVGVALAVGARTGRHGGLIAVGAVLTALVVLAGALEVLTGIPLAGGVGDRIRTPISAAEEYRWGMGKLTLDLRQAQGLIGEEIEASVVLGELIVIIPDGLELVVSAQAGMGEVVVIGRSSDGIDPSLACRGNSREVVCSDEPATAERALHLDLRVGLGKVEVRR